MGYTWVFFMVQVSTDRYTCSSGDDEFSLFHLDNEYPPRADKSALGAINRPLLVCQGIIDGREPGTRKGCHYISIYHIKIDRALVTHR